MNTIRFGQLKNHSFKISSCKTSGYEKYDMPYHAHPPYEIMYVNEGNNSSVFHRLVIEESGQNISVLEFYPIQDSELPLFPLVTQSKAVPELREFLNTDLPYYVISDSGKTHALITRILDELEEEVVDGTQKTSSRFLFNLYVTEILIDAALTRTRQRLREGNIHLNAALQHIKANYASKLTASKLAEVTGISLPYLNKIFNDAFSKSVMAYVNEYHINVAIRLLKENVLPIAKIAHRCGFATHQNFIYNFKKMLGVPPETYLKILAN